MSMWFENKEDGCFLFDESGNEFPIDEKWDREFEISKISKDEWEKATTYMKVKNIWDATGFGASMSCMIADAVTIVDGKLKVLVFSTVKCAERTLFKYYGRNFKRKCLRRIDEFYSKKEYQQKIRFTNLEVEEWNDHILRPIVLLVNENGEMEEVLKHKDFLNMEVFILKNAYEAIWFEQGRFKIEHTLRLYKEQYKDIK